MRTLLSAVIAASFLIAAGCNDAKSPDAVSNDVAKAERKGAADVAKSEDSAAKNLDSAAGKVDDKLVDFSNQAAKDAYNVTVAKADAQLKVALARCEGMSGDAQKSCKDQANADYDAAKANAKAAAQANKQSN
jgi:hypothetical protein